MLWSNRISRTCSTRWDHLDGAVSRQRQDCLWVETASGLFPKSNPVEMGVWVSSILFENKRPIMQVMFGWMPNRRTFRLSLPRVRISLFQIGEKTANLPHTLFVHNWIASFEP